MRKAPKLRDFAGVTQLVTSRSARHANVTK